MIGILLAINCICTKNNINLEPKIDDNQEKKEPEIIIDCSDKNILIVQQNIFKQEKENEDDKKYEDFLSKKNHKISDYFKLNENTYKERHPHRDDINPTA